MRERRTASPTHKIDLCMRSFCAENGKWQYFKRAKHTPHEHYYENLCVSCAISCIVRRVLIGFSIFLLSAGRPQPQVRWLVNGLIVDDQYEHNSGDVIENRLLWPSVQRTDLNSVFTCQAVNTLLVEPKENSYVLDLHCK